MQCGTAFSLKRTDNTLISHIAPIEVDKSEQVTAIEH